MSGVGFDVFTSRLAISGELKTHTPLRIGARRATDATESDNPVIKDILGNPVIPGSSLKGSLRSFVEMLLRGAAIQQNSDPNRLACDVFSQQICLPDHINPDKSNRPASDQEIIDHSCLACRVFGSPYVAGKLSIQDSPVAVWSQHYLLRDGVAIDRDTGTAADGLRYDFEAVPAGTTFSFNMQVDNPTDEELGLALIALRALQAGQVQLGGARSRGLGWCSVQITQTRYFGNPLDMLLDPDSVHSLDETTEQRALEAFQRTIMSN